MTETKHLKVYEATHKKVRGLQTVLKEPGKKKPTIDTVLDNLVTEKLNDLGIPESALTNHTHGNGKAQHDLQKNLKEGRH